LLFCKNFALTRQLSGAASQSSFSVKPTEVEGLLLVQAISSCPLPAIHLLIGPSSLTKPDTGKGKPG
jgi:hypothetical protein